MAAKTRQITYRNGATAIRSRRVAQPVYYTDGNTVRVARPEQAPARRHPQPQRRVRPAEREELAERTATVSINLPMTLLLVCTVIVTLFIGYQYLCLKSSLDIHMNTVKQLETELEAMRTENDAFEESIDTSVDLNHIYAVAVGELGMVHAGQDNIIQYDKTESEYVRQYEDIPATN